MITLKIKLTQDSVGALHAEFIDGLNSVSQNNAGKNIVEVILNGFELQTEEMLQIAYATSLNENDPMTENIGFNFMEKNYERNSWIAEVDPLVLDRSGVWYLGLRVVTETSGVIQTVSNETDMLEFTVNATLKDANGKYPTKADISALYQTAVNAVAQSGKIATETATQVASEVAENVTNEKLTPVIQVTNNELGASLELLLNDKTYELYAVLRAKNYEILSQQKVDLPLEEMIIDAYQNEGGNLVILLKNGQERTIELGALIKGLLSSSEKGQPNGVASLNEQGQVPSGQLPPLDYLPLTGGTVDGTIYGGDFLGEMVEATDIFAYSQVVVGSGEDETVYADGTISYGGNEFVFPEESGTIALQEPIDTQFAIINQALAQSGLLKKYKQPITQEYNERVTADGANVLDGSRAILKKVVGNTVAYGKDENGLNGKLKNASFGGIESTNADGMEASTISFPKTVMPLGKTIDIENKKITDYGVDVVLTGNEKFVYYKYSTAIRNCITVEDLNLLKPTSDAIKTQYVSTDSIYYGTDYSPKNIFVFFAQLTWLDILDTLKYTTAGVEPTTEEKAIAVAKFKAWVAQRYADGNPVTIRYISTAVQSETPFTAAQSASGNEYTAYKGGTEKVLDNDGAEFGTENTLTQDYILVTEVK